MGLTDILARDDVPQDVKQVITTLEKQLETYRKEFEELRQNEAKYRTLFESAPDTIVLVSPTGHIIDCNNAAGKLTGLSKEQLLGKHFSETGVVLEDDLPSYMKLFSEIFGGIQARNIEVKTIDKDSMIHYLELFLSFFKKNDEIHAIQVIVHDITNRRQIEEALKASEEKYRILFESAPIGISTSDFNGKALTFNQRTLEMMGYTANELKTIDLNDTYLDPNDRKEILQELQEQGSIVDREVLRKRKDGSEYCILMNSELIEIGGKKLFLTTVRDITEGKNAEVEAQKSKDALHGSERRFRELAELLPEIVFETDKEMKITFANKVAFKKSGYTQEEMQLGVTALQMLIPEDRNRALENISLMFAGEELGGREYTLQRKDGSSFPVMVFTSLILSENEPVGLRGLIVDMTERKLVEEAVRKERDRVQQYIDISGGIMFALDKQGNVILINKMGSQILGYNKQEIIGKNWFETFIPKRIREGLRTIFKAFITEKPRNEIEALYEKLIGSEFEFRVNPILTKSGSERLIIWANSLVRDDAGNITGIISSGQDITEQKQIEKALRESERKLQAIMDSMRKERDLAQKYLDIAGVMFVALDNEGHVTLINKKGCEILGYDEKEILGKNWFDNFLPEKIRENVKVPHKQLLRGEIEIAEHYINPILKKDGEERIIAWHNTIIEDEEGSIIGHLSSGEDITERIRAERIREELEERRENFIYMTTHELRTPLTVIGGYCDFLTEHDEFIDHFRREKIYNILRSNVNRLERLTRDVSHIVQLERGELLIKKCELNVCFFLKSILEPYDHLLEDQFSFQGCLEEHPITIHADPDRLQQVMENIISNAIKQTPKDEREIIVSMESSTENVRIFVSDNGAGIAPEHLETIFEQFITIPTDYTASGTGIGLYLSQEIIKAHGGTITAQSPGKGHGSTFTITIPRKTD